MDPRLGLNRAVESHPAQVVKAAGDQDMGAASGVPMAGRGAAFAGTLATMREVWRGDVAGARGPIPALPERHRGRALRGLGNREEARERLTVALRFFRDAREAYNTARTLTDLAETSLDSGDPAGALPLIDEAVTALAAERASYHLAHLRALRESCLDADQSAD